MKNIIYGGKEKHHVTRSLSEEKAVKRAIFHGKEGNRGRMNAGVCFHPL